MARFHPFPVENLRQVLFAHIRGATPGVDLTLGRAASPIRYGPPQSINGSPPRKQVKGHPCWRPHRVPECSARPHACSTKAKMTRFLLAFSGALFLGSIGAFFLLVPLLSIATVAWIFVGLLLMFTLGVQVGTQGMLRCESAAGQVRRSAITVAKSSQRLPC
jgi:hypothetical protein